MYEHLAGRPVQEKKDVRPGSQADYLNAPEKSGDKKFSPGDVRIQYDPRKTAQLKAHAFTQNSGGLKKASPRGVIQRIFWLYDAKSKHGIYDPYTKKFVSSYWIPISRFDLPGKYPLPTQSKDGAIFDDVTGKHHFPKSTEYKNDYNNLMRWRNEQAKKGAYKDANRLGAFTEAPHRMDLDTPFNKNKINFAKVYPIVRRHITSYLASARGMGKRGGNRKGSIAYKDVCDRVYPKGIFIAIANHLGAPPNAPIEDYAGDLTDEQIARIAGLAAIQFIEDWRAPTGGTLQIAFLKAAEAFGYEDALALYPLAPTGGTQATRDLLSGKKDFSQEQADMFLRFTPPSPMQSPDPNASGPLPLIFDDDGS